MDGWVIQDLLMNFPPLTQLAWLALSSCLGDDVRRRLFNLDLDPRRAIYDRHYMRTINGSALSEQIELQDTMEDPEGRDPEEWQTHYAHSPSRSDFEMA